ncbi:hypothetical protein ACWZHB_10825 [Nocardia sp. FBN12]|uniref:hypothetical protein n=1 Tax=Nocardia sp. FBN12 TaxID=3419766 RepID=UPI003CFDD12A
MILLLDPADDKNITATLLAGSNLSAGIITVHPTPGTRGSAMLAHDILVALGRSARRLEGQHIGSERSAWIAVRSWIRADDVRRVIVLRAHRLSEAGWTALIGLWRDTGTQVVLVCHGVGEEEALARFPDGVMPRVVHRADRVLRDRHARRSAPLASRTPRPLPMVPDTDVARFRADAFRRLSLEEFSRVDAVYRQGMDAACRWSATLPDPATAGVGGHIGELLPRGRLGSELIVGAQALAQRYGEAELRRLAAGLLCVGYGHGLTTFPQEFDDAEEVHRFVTGLVARAHSAQHAITLLRGAQAGALLHGVLLQMPSDLVDLTGPGLTGIPITPQVAAHLRSEVVNPAYAGAVAVAVYTGFDTEDLMRIPVAAVSDEGGTLRWNTAQRWERPDWCVLAMPEASRPFLAAARTYAILQGLAPDKPLFKASAQLTGPKIAQQVEAAGLAPAHRTPASCRWWRTVRAWHVATPLHNDRGYVR